MVKQIKYQEQKVFYLNVKTVDTAEILESLTKRKTLNNILLKEKKFNNGSMILYIVNERLLLKYIIPLI